MPTILSHPAPILCLGFAAGRRLVPWRLLAAGLLCSILPDLDVISFKFGVRYAETLGHRGLSHSLVFACAVGCLAFLVAPLLKSSRTMAFLVCAGAVLLHSVLDAMTNGGLGVAFLWPFEQTRYFLPWQPIEVSPFSPRQFISNQAGQILSPRGAKVLLSEVVWVWAPSVVAGIVLFAIRKWIRPAHAEVRYSRSTAFRR